MISKEFYETINSIVLLSGDEDETEVVKSDEIADLIE